MADEFKVHRLNETGLEEACFNAKRGIADQVDNQLDLTWQTIP